MSMVFIPKKDNKGSWEYPPHVRIDRFPQHTFIYWEWSLFEKKSIALWNHGTTAELYQFEYHDADGKSVVVKGNDLNEVQWRFYSKAYNWRYFTFRNLSFKAIRGKGFEELEVQEYWANPRRFWKRRGFVSGSPHT